MERDLSHRARAVILACRERERCTKEKRNECARFDEAERIGVGRAEAECPARQRRQRREAVQQRSGFKKRGGFWRLALREIGSAGRRQVRVR